MHTCTEQSHTETSYNPSQFKKYRTKLLSLNKLRDQIIEDVSREKVKARRGYDVAYHEKLIREDVIRLYDSDKTFISEHGEVYANANNPRYIKMLKDKKEALLSEKQREHLAMQERKQREHLAIKQEEQARARAKKRKECGGDMTPDIHYAKKGGKITGKVSGSDPQGYFLESWNGGGETSYYVKGGPLRTGGHITLPLYVISKGEQKQTLLTNMGSGVETKSMALVVHYNDKCNE